MIKSTKLLTYDLPKYDGFIRFLLNVLSIMMNFPFSLRAISYNTTESVNVFVFIQVVLVGGGRKNNCDY